MRFALPSALVGLALAGTACGGEDPEARYRLTTPEERAGQAALPEIKKQQEQAAADARIRPSKADAKRLSPILRGWADAVRRNDYDRASAYFTVPAIVAQGNPMRLETRDHIKAFNAALPCGARLLHVTHESRYVIGTFRLTERPEHKCDAPGELVRVAFVLRGQKIAEWRQMTDEPDASPGPDAPEDAPPLPVEAAA